jgi:hypothetical protein
MLIMKIKDNDMQVRTWTYLQFASRSLRHLMRPFDRGTSAETPPLLIYIAAVLVVLLAVLEIDAHKLELESLGLLANNYPVPVALLGP